MAHIGARSALYTARDMRALLASIRRFTRRTTLRSSFKISRQILRHDTKILKFHAQTAARFAARNFKSYVQKQLARAE